MNMVPHKIGRKVTSLCFFDSDEVILDQYTVGSIVLVSHDFTSLYRTQYSRIVINCIGQGSHWLIERPHV